MLITLYRIEITCAVYEGSAAAILRQPVAMLGTQESALLTDRQLTSSVTAIHSTASMSNLACPPAFFRPWSNLDAHLWMPARFPTTAAKVEPT